MGTDWARLGLVTSYGLLAILNASKPPEREISSFYLRVRSNLLRIAGPNLNACISAS
jgi:hypothetical protein